MRGKRPDDDGSSPWAQNGQSSILDRFGQRERTGRGAHLHIAEEAFVERGQPVPSSVSEVETQLLLGIRPAGAGGGVGAPAGSPPGSLQGHAGGRPYQQQQQHQHTAHPESPQRAVSKYHHHYNSINVIGSSPAEKPRNQPQPQPQARGGIPEDIHDGDDFLEEVKRLRDTNDNDVSLGDYNVYGTPKPHQLAAMKNSPGKALPQPNGSKEADGGVLPRGGWRAGQKRAPPSPMATMEAEELREELRRLRQETEKLRESMGNTLDTGGAIGGPAGQENARHVRFGGARQHPAPPQYDISSAPELQRKVRDPLPPPVIGAKARLGGKVPGSSNVARVSPPSGAAGGDPDDTIPRAGIVYNPLQHAPPFPVRHPKMHPVAVSVNQQYNSHHTQAAMDALLSGAPLPGGGDSPQSKSPSKAMMDGSPESDRKRWKLAYRR